MMLRKLLNIITCKKAYWDRNESDTAWHCSECGYSAKQFWDRCPECGCKMIGNCLHGDGYTAKMTRPKLVQE